MTAEEVFDDLYDKCNWTMIAFTDKYFVSELKKQIGEQNALFTNPVYAVAKYDFSNDVLFLIGGDSRGDIYRIYNLTPSNDDNKAYKEFVGIEMMWSQSH